jgi:serine/threonine-protein kinase
MLTGGTRLGPYEIVAPIGAGGMGEVYRARDARLHRDVAIKVLPEAVARDPERLARFEREAQVLAALNHPHIGSIYGLEEADGVRALVLELVPGETLAERIAAGPIPVDEALAIARQIGDALEAAHERGIIHRDLKPANVKIAPDGMVKVLDFGLAKALSADGSAPDVTHSPTLTAQATQAGVVIGTAAYMSPEQARGRPVDKRSDIWSFGAVLYEMLTGRRCFEGETVSDVLASVLRQDPDWSRLPAETPIQTRALLRRCLERDPKKRLRDIGDAWIEMTPEAPAAASASRPRGSPLAWIAAMLAALAVGFAAARWLSKPPASPAGVAVHSVVPLPAGTRLAGWASPVVAISRDGRALAFVAQKEDERAMLWVDRLDTGEARVVPDSDSAEGPFFSPDGQWVGFATNVSGEGANGTGAIRKFSLATGLTQVVARIPDYYGGSWGEDGTILVAPSTTEGLWRIPADGGSPDTSLQSVLWKGKPARRALTWPQRISPQLVMLCQEGDSPWGGAAVLDVPSKRLEPFAPEVSFSRYTSDGHVLLFRPDRTLMAARFDPASGHMTGSPVAILKDVANGGNGAAALAVSDNGTLVYATGFIRRSGIEPTRLARLSEKGEIELLPFAADAFGVPMPSPDGKSLAVITFDGSVWIYDLVRQVRSRLPLAGRRAQGLTVVWSPDGSAVAYSVSAEGEAGWSVCRQRADGGGPPEQIVPAGGEQFPLAWTPDGSFLVVMQYETPRLTLASVDRSAPPRKIVDANVSGASLSPDGHWLAYAYRDADGWRTVVDRTDGSGPRVLLAAGTQDPRWSPDGRFVYCWREDRLLRVPVSAGARILASTPEELFRVSNLRGSSVAPDGRSFYAVLLPPDSGIVRELHLVTNWFSELERLSPARSR